MFWKSTRWIFFLQYLNVSFGDQNKNKRHKTKFMFWNQKKINEYLAEFQNI